MFTISNSDKEVMASVKRLYLNHDMYEIRLVCMIYNQIMFTISTCDKKVMASLWRLPQPFASYQNMLQTFQGFYICNFVNKILMEMF